MARSATKPVIRSYAWGYIGTYGVIVIGGKSMEEVEEAFKRIGIEI